MERIIEKDEKFCFSCGEVIKKEAEICPKCGVRQLPPPASSSKMDERKLAAGLLAILLGGLGIHKFYLGDTGKGILYLCFCWTGIPSIIGIIEGVIFLTQSDEEFNQKYPKQ